jgi:hypothetical protein
VFNGEVGDDLDGSMTYEELTPAVAKDWQIEWRCDRHPDKEPT